MLLVYHTCLTSFLHTCYFCGFDDMASSILRHPQIFKIGLVSCTQLCSVGERARVQELSILHILPIHALQEVDECL